MKLWLLNARDDATDDQNPWWPEYDCAYGFVVVAENEHEARLIASEQAGDETPMAWLSHEFSNCAELLPDGRSQIILRNFFSS